MVESVKELNEKVQKPQYKEVGNWMVRKILRPAAVPVTWVLLHTPVTANQVTLAALIVGLAGAALCAAEVPAVYFAGALLLQLWYFLDHVDGQIARYRGTSCLTGRFFDFLMHHLIHGAFFFAPACYMFAQTEDFGFIVWGFAVSMCMTGFNILHDIKYKTFFEFMSKSPGAVRQPAAVKAASAPAKASAGQRVFSFFHKLIEMHVIMNLFTLSAFLDLFGLDTRATLFALYGVLVPFCFIAKSAAWIKGRKVDAEFNAQNWNI